MVDFYSTLDQFQDFNTREDNLVWTKDRQADFLSNEHTTASLDHTYNLEAGLGR